MTTVRQTIWAVLIVLLATNSYALSKEQLLNIYGTGEYKIVFDTFSIPLVNPGEIPDNSKQTRNFYRMLKDLNPDDFQDAYAIRLKMESEGTGTYIDTQNACNKLFQIKKGISVLADTYYAECVLVKGVDDRKIDEAMSRLRLSAISGHPYAQFLMGAVYDFGFAVMRNYADAFAWFNISTESGVESFVHYRDFLVSSIPREYITAGLARTTEIAVKLSE